MGTSQENHGVSAYTAQCYPALPAVQQKAIQEANRGWVAPPPRQPVQYHRAVYPTGPRRHYEPCEVEETGIERPGLAFWFIVAGGLILALILLAHFPTTNSASEIMTSQSLAQGIANDLSEKGYQTDSVTCLNDLPASVGSSVRCTRVYSGETQGVTATVTSVEPGRIHYWFQLDSTPTVTPN